MTEKEDRRGKDTGVGVGVYVQFYDYEKKEVSEKHGGIRKVDGRKAIWSIEHDIKFWAKGHADGNRRGIYKPQLKCFARIMKRVDGDKSIPLSDFFALDNNFND